MKAQGVYFREIEVSRNEEAYAEAIRISGQRSMPVTVIGGRPVVGFNPVLIKLLLDLAEKERAEGP